MYYNFNNMTDEEKKAFQYYKECNEKDLENYEYLHEVSQKQAKYLEILLNLIEKQSKEIEELKENGEVEPLFYVSKDKIKAKIEELQKEKIEMTVDIINHNTLAEIIRDEQINILQLLLEKE